MGERPLISFYSFALILSVSLFGASTEVAAQQQWREVRPPGAGFRIEFPEEPKTEWKDLPSGSGTVPALISLLSRQDGLDFMSIYSDFPAGTFSANPQGELDTLRNNSVNDVRGVLRSEAKLTVGGAPARRVVISFFDGKSIATILFILNGTRLYQAICIAPQGKENGADVSRFIGSLTLVPR